jgi:glycosyltransferase involved in cell wall biosynthesis
MKISIITVAYNSAGTIGDTLQSVHSQDYPDIEHIIIDGRSTDGTLDIVRKFPKVARVVSEKDNGLYDAMNKGIKLASGEVIGILNSDDVYSGPTVISSVAALFANKNNDTVYGDLQYVQADDLNRVVRTWRSGHFKRSSFYYGWMPPHPAFFVRKTIYERVGLFNTSLRSASDYEMMLRILFKNNFNAAYLAEVLVKMRAGGISNASFRNRLVANREDRKAWKLNQLEPYFFTLYLKPLRKVLQFLIR